MKRNQLAGLAVVVVGLALLSGVPTGVAQPLAPGGEKNDTADSPAENVAPAAEPASPAAPILTFLKSLDLLRLWSANDLVNWLSPLAGLALGFLIGSMAAGLLHWLARPLRSRGWNGRSRIIAGLAGPLWMILATLGFQIGLLNFHYRFDPDKPPALVENLLDGAIGLAYTIAVVWYLVKLVAVVEAAIARIRGKSESPLDRQLVGMIGTTLRVTVLVLGALWIAQTVFAANVGAWLAGLGIVGLGVSLAAQDSIKNFFGSVTILLDRPFVIGERIVFGGYDGTVEEIGFRSTKVRTLAGNLVTIPNSKIANESVENFARRPTIRRILNVTITYDTPRAKIEEGVEILRRIMAEEGIREPIHPVVGGDELFPRVYFNDYNADSLNLFAIYWYTPPVWWDYMEHAHRLNLRIFEEFDAAGIEFAFPTQTLFLAGDAKRPMAVEMLSKNQDAE